MSNKSKTWRYHKWHRYLHVKSERDCHFVTQLYKIGVYGILNNSPSMQGSFSPSQIVAMEKKLSKKLKENVIANLEYGPEIKVTEIDGFFAEIE